MSLLQQLGLDNLTIVIYAETCVFYKNHYLVPFLIISTKQCGYGMMPISKTPNTFSSHARPHLSWLP